MLEWAVLSIFIAGLLVCVAWGKSILYALILGYCVFYVYGLSQKYTLRQLLGMSYNGIKTVKNILLVFPLIGMITAVWRACGVIPFIIVHTSGFLMPSVFLLATFLLCCLISTLTGTSFGTVATVGVICMTLANAIGIDQAFVGGAVLSGIYFGDRCSPMSTSALLVSELTGTDIYRNVKNMVRTSVVPFIAACVLYWLLGAIPKSGAASIEIAGLFAEHFNLHWVVVLPAVIIVVLCACRVKVRTAMAVSIFIGCAITLLVQGFDVLSLLRLLVFGFHASDPQLAAMMDGGGILSMVQVTVIVCLSACYAGIFDGTGLLRAIRGHMIRMSEKITPFGGILVTAVVTSMAACSQTLAIMLTFDLCKETVPDRERMAVNLANTAVIIPAMIPWSIACATPLAILAAPGRCVFFAFYLYLLVLWNLFRQGRGLADSASGKKP